MSIDKKLTGASIRAELNDLKRTPEAAAKELGLTPEAMGKILDGKSKETDVMYAIGKMQETYPIMAYDLIVPEDDAPHGVKVVSKEDSAKSSRVFQRKNADGELTDYYDYRDTALGRLSPFRPEWIRELRVVKDNDPNNPNVAYNKGHLMPQATFFIGEVVFYWQDREGKKHCKLMRTGDSNYITPFFPHSFARPEGAEESLIIAMTFGGEARRAKSELYRLGNINPFMLDLRDPNKATTQLIRQYLKNLHLPDEEFEAAFSDRGFDALDILDPSARKKDRDLCIAADVLGLDISDLMLPSDLGDDVVVKKHDPEQGWYFPSDDAIAYELFSLAASPRMPQMRGVDIHVKSDISGKVGGVLESTLHNYLYNYGKQDAEMGWRNGDLHHQATLRPGDSAYVKPNVPFTLSGEGAKVVKLSIPGNITLATQKEMSMFEEEGKKRLVQETTRWY